MNNSNAGELRDWDFLWEMPNGQVGSFLVEKMRSQQEAEKIVRAENPEVLDCLIEVNDYEV
ncbi:MAG: hypothetical protein Q7U23_09040 [Methylococcales bacterium]|jgi:hypothetical protein|nr:hypothetical protein [Methylococcales bacterium]MDP3331475.1 hypothetical protein [Methylococcaceae bacterium]